MQQLQVCKKGHRWDPVTDRLVGRPDRCPVCGGANFWPRNLAWDGEDDPIFRPPSAAIVPTRNVSDDTCPSPMARRLRMKRKPPFGASD